MRLLGHFERRRHFYRKSLIVSGGSVNPDGVWLLILEEGNEMWLTSLFPNLLLPVYLESGQETKKMF